MKSNFIKKLLLLFIFSVITLFAACDIFMSNKNIIKYYSDDSNYETIECVLVAKDTETENTIIVDIQTKDSSYTPDHYQYYCFHFYFDTEIFDQLNTGDIITITSAPMTFYNGHLLPIIALEKDGETLISFEEGKAAYLHLLETEW